MRPPDVLDIDTAVRGHWRLIAHPGLPGSKGSIDVSDFRDVPVDIQSMSFADPFGPKAATIAFPQISYYDRRGEGDLWWLTPWTTFEVVWVGSFPAGYPYGKIQVAGDPVTWWHPRHLGFDPAFSWLGRLTSFRFDSKGASTDFQGAYYQLDDWSAKPEYPHSPLPYEWAIAKQFLNRPALRLKPLTILWPSWWSTTYTPPPKKTDPAYIPSHVVAGRNWLGLVTRETGKWDPVGTSYINSLLANMYTRRGRWTIDILEGGMPVLLHRDILYAPNAFTVVIDAAGTNELSIDEDWMQSLSVVYAQGQSLAGVAFSGMQVSPDGHITSYEPMAALRQVHPETPRHNEWFQPGRPRREVMLQAQSGLTELDAQLVAQAHLERFSHPGQTGTLVLREDPTIGGVPVSRMLVRAGMSFQVPGIGGVDTGLIAHITENEINFREETNTLTFDTKYRDALTVREVKLRGRDALAIPRMLVVGQYQPPLPDQLLPWNYDEGSGYIPGAMPGGSFTALRLFDEMPNDIQFPWEDWTTQRPPSNPRWRKSYARIGLAKANANKNWCTVARNLKGQPGGGYGIPIRVAQQGDIRLLQVAAYDSDGHVLPVPFHVSFYTSEGVNIASMPEIPANALGNSDYPPFSVHQRYPFIKDGWNTYTAAGTLTSPQVLHPTTGAGLIRGYGDYYERAGYWPGSYGQGDPATGLLVDENVWHFNTTDGGPNYFDPYVSRQKSKWRGTIYAMIYCDAQGDEPVYFLGRMFRAEPGTSG